MKDGVCENGRGIAGARGVGIFCSRVYCESAEALGKSRVASESSDKAPTVGEAGGHEAVGQVGDTVEGCGHERREADPLDVRAGLGVVVEHPPVVLVDHPDPVAGVAQAIGGVHDSGTHTEDGMEENDRRHGRTLAPPG